MHSVRVTRRAEKDLARLDATVLTRVLRALSKLEADPRPSGCRKVMVSDGLWRIRVGDYRIGYTIDDHEMVVKIVRVDHRRAFYE